MKSMKKLALCCAVGAVMATTAMPAQAALEDNVIKLIQTVSGKGAGAMCRKGNFFGGVFSLRSLEGNLCTIKYVAALAELTCTNPQTLSENEIKDYMQSQCHQKAEVALKGEDPKAVLANAIKSGVGKSRDLVCKNASKFPSVVQGATGPACKTAG